MLAIVGSRHSTSRSWHHIPVLIQVAACFRPRLQPHVHLVYTPDGARMVGVVAVFDVLSLQFLSSDEGNSRFSCDIPLGHCVLTPSPIGLLFPFPESWFPVFYFDLSNEVHSVRGGYLECHPCSLRLVRDGKIALANYVHPDWSIRAKNFTFGYPNQRKEHFIGQYHVNQANPRFTGAANGVHGRLVYFPQPQRPNHVLRYNGVFGPGIPNRLKGQ